MEKYYVEINNVEYEVLVRSEPKNKGLSKSKIESKEVYNDHPETESSQNTDSLLKSKQNLSSNTALENDDLKSVKAPMSSIVLSIDVSEGDLVAKDQLLLVIEAMKMETEITAPVAGEILEIKAQAGIHCSQGEEMIVIRETGDK